MKPLIRQPSFVLMVCYLPCCMSVSLTFHRYLSHLNVCICNIGVFWSSFGDFSWCQQWLVWVMAWSKAESMLCKSHCLSHWAVLYSSEDKFISSKVYFISVINLGALRLGVQTSASEMTYTVSGGALNSAHSLTQTSANDVHVLFLAVCWNCNSK